METSVNFLTASRIISLIYNDLQPSSVSSPPLHSQIPLPRSQPRAVVPVLSVTVRAYPGLLPTTLFVHQMCSLIPFQLSAREEAQSPAQQVSASPGFSSRLLGSVSTGWELELIPNATLEITVFFQRKNRSFGTCTTGASDSNVKSMQDLKELNSMLWSMFTRHILVSMPCGTSLLPASGWPVMSVLSPEWPLMAGRSWCNASPFLSCSVKVTKHTRTAGSLVCRGHHLSYHFIVSWYDFIWQYALSPLLSE